MKILAFVICFCILLAGVTRSSAQLPNECVQLTYHRTMICEWPVGTYTNYTAGDVVLAGTPHDNSWNNQYFQLSGHLVNNGSCTMLVVDKATACSSPTK